MIPAHFFLSIGLDKSEYQVNIFLISPQKCMLWVLIRSASSEYPQHMFSWRNKTNTCINTFGLKKNHLLKSYAPQILSLNPCHAE